MTKGKKVLVELKINIRQKLWENNKDKTGEESVT
jgi:hypothetical protein